MTQDEPTFLYRFGREFESAERLEAACEDAVAHGFPHGISAFSRSAHPDACRAERSRIEVDFTVHRTGRNRLHYTIHLPHPVTSEIAAKVNRLFNRSGSDA